MTAARRPGSHPHTAVRRTPPTLIGWSHQPRTIGGRMLLGRSVLFEVIEVGGPDRLHGGGLVSAAVRDGFGLEQRLAGELVHTRSTATRESERAGGNREGGSGV